MIAFWPRGDRIRERITAKPSQATVNFQRALWIADRDHVRRSHPPIGGSIEAPAFGFRPMRIAVQQQQPQSASAMTWQKSRQGDG